ncbi:MAG: p-hydroxybenzoic acid efflux pump subunit AaeA [Herbaspirillum frisingense]|uniref:p-hydroxybenzoic acid efflux pump subunit AaeA n=1 Tax=Herbaspirillum frisingense TaxID=92645 RepID=A0A7V8FX74_9BURK|nr:MAG: p-hydroxybenzoic acid efflux pump subunit AaeA [Herbaspirillum frisingense]
MTASAAVSSSCSPLFVIPLRRRLLLTLCVLPLALALGACSGRGPSTDDASVSSAIVPVTPEIAGQVREVLVKEGDEVKKGQLLVRLTPDPQEMAKLKQSVNELLGNSRQQAYDNGQMPALQGMGVVIDARYNDEANEARLSQLVAPADGRVSDLTVRAGDALAEDQVVLRLSPVEVIVTARFKDKETGKLHVGQEATVRLQDEPGQAFTGRIKAIGGATGAAGEGQAGSFVNVVERKPVQIAVDVPPEARALFLPQRGAIVEMRKD